MKLEVFDPPMCCATGVCGNSVDPKLVTFAADLEWLKKQGIDVVRHGLSFEPAEFVKNEDVKYILHKEGNESLPVIIRDQEMVTKGHYPSREQLAKICKIEYKKEENEESIPVKMEVNSCCGPDCDCHKSSISDTTKKIIFAAVLLIIVGIIAVKFSCKANAAETKKNIVSQNKTASVNFGQYIDSVNPLKLSKDVAFVFIPSKENGNISAEAKNAAVSSKKILNGKNIKVNFYTLKTTSADYQVLAPNAYPPSIMVIKGQGESFVSGEINQTRLLQAYMITIQPGCGAGCPCHKK